MLISVQYLGPGSTTSLHGAMRPFSLLSVRKHATRSTTSFAPDVSFAPFFRYRHERAAAIGRTWLYNAVRGFYHLPASEIPPGVKIELDFFGEPVSFLGIKPSDKVNNAMAAMDGFLLAAITKGRTCVLGGDEAGIFMKAPHSVAVAWAEALRFATFWNQPMPVVVDDADTDTDDNTASDDDITADRRRRHKSSPMLAVVAVAPLLAHTGLSYAKHLDTLLKQTRPPVPGFPEVQMLDLARCAVDRADDPFLNIREKMVMIEDGSFRILAALLSAPHN